jgi:parvulin-like peptidyl-prolyl isomerase
VLSLSSPHCTTVVTPESATMEAMPSAVDASAAAAAASLPSSAAAVAAAATAAAAVAHRDGGRLPAEWRGIFPAANLHGHNAPAALSLSGAAEGSAWGAALLAAYRAAVLAGDRRDWAGFLAAHQSGTPTRFLPRPAAVKTLEEVHARHVLVKTEDEAKAVLADIKKGTDFAEVAKAKSTEPGAAQSGGDLGYFTKEQMVPEFAEAAFKLDKGKVSEPVKTQFGWHIIKVEDKRKKPVPTFDQVKDQLETFVARKSQSDLVAKLRTTAKIEKTAAAAPAAPAAPATPAAPAPAAAPTKK